MLAKAREAFNRNSEQERYWIWTSTTTRTILDKSGKAVETIPSITVESPIRGDGKRCSAVLAWGDGLAPYLANASAEERCKVQEEIPPTFRMEAILQAEHAKVKARTDAEITLAILPDKQTPSDADGPTRCAGSVEGTVGLDPETFFPKRVDLKVVGQGCKLSQTDVEDHYGGATVRASGGLLKGSQIETTYELQKDKTGDASRNYWIAVRQRRDQPLAKNVAAIVVSGRVFHLASKGQERRAVLETSTQASEVSTQSKVTFEISK